MLLQTVQAVDPVNLFSKAYKYVPFRTLFEQA
jgi:hypothetical protein